MEVNNEYVRCAASGLSFPSAVEKSSLHAQTDSFIKHTHIRTHLQAALGGLLHLALGEGQDDGLDLRISGEKAGRD